MRRADTPADELNRQLAERRDRRNHAIRTYQPDHLDEIDAGDEARAEMDLILRIEAYDPSDVKRFAEIVGAYLHGAPERDKQRLMDNLMRLHEVVARTDA